MFTEPLSPEILRELALCARECARRWEATDGKRSAGYKFALISAHSAEVAAADMERDNDALHPLR